MKRIIDTQDGLSRLLEWTKKEKNETKQSLLLWAITEIGAAYSGVSPEAFVAVCEILENSYQETGLRTVDE